MIRCGIRQVASGYYSVPGSNHRSIPCHILQTAERIELERDIKKYLEIIQQYCMLMSCANDVSQKSRYLQLPLPLRQLKHTPAEFEIHVDIIVPSLLCHFSQRSRFSCSQGSHYEYQSMVHMHSLGKSGA